MAWEVAKGILIAVATLAALPVIVFLIVRGTAPILGWVNEHRRACITAAIAAVVIITALSVIGEELQVRERARELHVARAQQEKVTAARSAKWMAREERASEQRELTRKREAAKQSFLIRVSAEDEFSRQALRDEVLRHLDELDVAGKVWWKPGFRDARLDLLLTPEGHKAAFLDER